MAEHDTCSYCGIHIDGETAGELGANVERHEASCEKNPNLA